MSKKKQEKKHITFSLLDVIICYLIIKEKRVTHQYQSLGVCGFDNQIVQNMESDRMKMERKKAAH